MLHLIVIKLFAMENMDSSEKCWAACVMTLSVESRCSKVGDGSLFEYNESLFIEDSIVA